MPNGDAPKVHHERLGSGVGWFVFGVLALLGGLFLSAAGEAAGALLGALGGGLIVVGFWVRLFSAIEKRLIDIELWLKRWPDPLAVRPANPSEPPSPDAR